jgi:hypothetical protein
MNKVYIIIATVILLVVIGGGVYFTKYKDNYFGNDLIQVTYPLPETKITNPLIIKGKAKGTWYFEASFPVILTNWDGLIISQGIAQAQSDWMTEDFVPFTATLNFEKPNYGERGFLILKKDNPSGLSQYDDAIEIPINFK